MKCILFSFALICSTFYNISHCVAQKETWSQFFPGYDPYNYYASIDVNKNLNMTLASITAGLPSKFISIDKNGYVNFSENTLEIALLHFKDNSLNRYLVSYDKPVLRIKKYDNQGILIYNTSNIISNAVTVGSGGVESYQFISSCDHKITSNGSIVISGLFKIDTVNTFNYETIDLFFVNPLNGTLINQYVQVDLETTVVESILQEDALGNINIFYYNEVQEDSYLKKVSPSGNLLMSRQYGDYWNGTPQKRALKFTDNFIYILLQENNFDITLTKLNKTTFDTVFHVNTLLTAFEIYDFWDANDTAFFMSYDDGMFGAFRSYDAFGNISCQDNSGNFLNYGYKFIMNGSKCYSARTSFSQRDTACIFSVCSPTFDSNTQELIYGNIGFYAYPDDNYSAEGITFIRSLNAADIPGLVGLVDEKPKNFSGRLYHDLNLNCALDGSEPGIPNQLIQIDPPGNFLFTDQNGNFQNYTDSGAYTLSAIPFNNTLSVCPASSPLNILDTLQIYSGNNFGVQDVSGNLMDLSITIDQTTAVPGITSYIYLTISNLLPLPATGVIALTVDTSIFLLTTSNIPADSSSGNIHYWHVNNLNYLSQQVLMIGFYVKTQVLAGTLYASQAAVTNNGGENNIVNNIDLFQGEVYSSYDPNDKNVVPKGYGSQGVISPVDSVLNYKIRFQNTGNYMAFKVSVIDTIDASLNISSFQLRSTSHACQLEFISANVIQFTFNNINLPDSGSNFALSNGFINYSINLKTGLPVNQTIKNKAHIYFDYNEPVTTNEVTNTIGVVDVQEFTSVSQIEIFPNPVNELLNVKIKSSESIQKVSVLDLSGRENQTFETVPKTSIIQLPVLNLIPGFYLIKVETKSRSFVKSFIKM